MRQRAKELAAEERQFQDGQHDAWLEQQITAAFSRYDAGESEFISNNEIECPHGRAESAGRAGNIVISAVQWEKQAQAERAA